MWNGCTVTLHYPALLQCSETEFVKEFTDAWSSLNRLYLKEYNAKSNKTHAVQQLKILQEFINNYSIVYPNVSELFLILISSPANTSCIERGFTFLEMICSKRRNHITPSHLETLFLLASLKIPVKSLNEYSKEIDILEK